MKLTLLPRRQSGSRSDKRKARGRGLPPSSGVVLSNEARVRVRSFGFVQPCCSGTLWLSDAVCLRVHCATVPWEWLHKVLCASRDSIPRPSNLLSERDPLCRRGSRVNFMKLTLLPRRCIYRKADRVPTKGKLEAAGFLPLLALFCLTKLGFACEALALSSRAAMALCGFRTPCAYVCTVRQYHGWLHKVLCASRVSIPRPSNLLSERDPLCDKCIGAEAELTSCHNVHCSTAGQKPKSFAREPELR